MPKKLDLKSKTKYEQWKAVHGFVRVDQDEFKKVNTVRDSFAKSRQARQSGCYHTVSTSDSSTLTGGDWEDRWVKQEKAYLKWAKSSSAEDWRSNVKSPMIQSRVDNFVNQWKKLNLGWSCVPNTDKDRISAAIINKCLDWWYKKSNAKSELGKVAWSVAVHGTGIFRVCYKKQFVNVRYPKTTYLGNEDMETVEKELSKGKIEFGQLEEKAIKDEISLEFVPIREYYPQPSAWSIHGESNAATWNIRRRFIDIENFKSFFKDYPGVKNLSKVKPISKYSSWTDYQFFQSPGDTIDQNSVELLEYENILTDEYLVVANDILIIDSPLPYKHKELSYHAYNFIVMPGQFYGISVADLLLQIQAVAEVTENLTIDHGYRSFNQQTFVGSSVFGQVIEDLLRGDNELIPVDDSDGSDIRSKIVARPHSSLGFDPDKMLDRSERNATISSQIDSSQLALLQANKTATATLNNIEQLQIMIQGVVDNFANDAAKPAGLQIASLMEQFWSIPKVEKVAGQDNEYKESYKQIRLDGVELEIDQENNKIIEKEAKEAFSFFSVEPQYLRMEQKPDIFIQAESMKIMSRSFEMQKMQESFAQLMQFAVDPSNSKQLTTHPMPLFDAVKLAQRYVEAMELPADILIKPEVNTEREIKRAEDHVTRLIGGEEVPGEPGESSVHTTFEGKALVGIDQLIGKLDAEIQMNMEIQLTKAQPEYDPNTGAPVPFEPIPDQNLLRQMEKLKQVRDRISRHLAIDTMPASLAAELALSNAQGNESTPPQAQEQGMDPAMMQGMDPAMMQGMDPAMMQGIDPAMMQAQM